MNRIQYIFTEGTRSKDDRGALLHPVGRIRIVGRVQAEHYLIRDVALVRRPYVKLEERFDYLAADADGERVLGTLDD